MDQGGPSTRAHVYLYCDASHRGTQVSKGADIGIYHTSRPGVYYGDSTVTDHGTQVNKAG